MIYSIRAKFNSERLKELSQKLIDGTIENQKPDGLEIINSMKRAKITEPGIVQWSEMCFCSPPLDHERQTVYDKYFTELKINSIEGYVEFDGESFFDYLKRLYH